MSTETLTSLAMLKVHVDQGRDYLDYLRPFILHVLVTHRPDQIIDTVVREYLRKDFGLEIPERAIQLVLKRLSRQYPLKKEMGIYRIAGNLPDPQISVAKADSARHIKAVIAELREYSKNTPKPIETDEEAVTAICSFLAEFSIPCLKAYLRGTTIPTVKARKDSQIILVSNFVLALQAKPDRFESFLVLVKGHMLANALLCPDLKSAPKTYNGLTVFLDTPLLVRFLGLEGEPKQAAVSGLVKLLLNLGATVATFSHLRDELHRVILGAAEHIESSDARTTIVQEARKSGTSKSDLLVVAGQIDDRLKESKIAVIQTPPYLEKYQIDETAFEKALDDELNYFNPNAKQCDINSVRSIYALRERTIPIIIEQSKAVLVTSNTAFSRAAFQYGQKHQESREVSSVITDFSLANIAWLKAPLGAPLLPMTEVLAFSYAALQPSKELLDKYLKEIEKLEKQGKITARDHQLLRSSQLAQAEMMNLTLGEETALTEQTVTETLRRATEEIKKEENEKFKSEQTAHQKTLEQLADEIEKNKIIQERIYWLSRRRATICAWSASFFTGLMLTLGLLVGLGLRSNNPIVGGAITVATGSLFLLSLFNLIFGTTVRSLHEQLQNFCLKRSLKKKTSEIGLNLSEI